jgi:hypothetical protein
LGESGMIPTMTRQVRSQARSASPEESYLCRGYLNGMYPMERL